jgi:hypothetical protein
MTIAQSINRLSYTIKNQNKPNTSDVNALNEVISFINQTTKQEVHENELFAKLYVSNFIMQLRLTSNLDLAQKNVNRILKMKLITLYEHARMDVNVVEIKDYFNNKGFKEPYSSENIKLNSNLAATINPIEFNDVCQTWDYAETETNLNAMITFALNEFKNV